MNIVIIGSLGQFDDMLKIKMIAEEQGHSVILPNPNDDRDLVEIYFEWLCIMDQADQVIAIPKCWKENEDGKSFSVKFGEATSYEIAYARHIGKELKVLVPKTKTDESPDDTEIEGDQNG